SLSVGNTDTLMQNNPITAIFTVKNNSMLYPVNIGRVAVAVRDSRNVNYDFAGTSEITLTPGQEYTYSQSRKFDKTGTYRFWIANYRSAHGWSDTYPASESGNLTRNIQVNIKDPVSMTGGLTLPSEGIYQDEDITA